MRPFALALLVLAAGALPASAQDAPRPRPEAFQRMQARFDRALNLTDAQKASVKEIRARHQAAIEARRSAGQAAHTAFADALRNPDTAAADLKKLHQAAADANFDQLLEHRAMRLEIRAVLTPEQREKAARLEGRMEGMRMGGMAMGHRGGQPGAMR